ncbi:hypothetical protein RB620_00370 [Paenibacillus sp. LHD-117]|uniref:hypothetical protein n=1 Tax=Paenibacillus sp. LHD-117 TaxID=3071412 RepID=UPI0027E00509|nr:hypothetical protein [Paenibacillus sp. LHD-117]MDQ6417879.1 hypothetical protein [Paenibacillus sp. LHD-117]
MLQSIPYIPSEREEFVYFGLTEFIGNLVAEPITLSDDIEVEVPNIHSYNSHGVQQVQRITIRREAHRFVFSIILHELMPGLNCDVFEIFTDEQRCCFSVDNNLLATEERPEGCCWELSVDPYKVTVEIPVALINRYGNAECCLVLSVTRWGTGPLSTFIPIRILKV